MVLGDALREFKNKICPNFATRELQQEAEARECREASKAAKASKQTSNREVLKGPTASGTQLTTTRSQPNSQTAGQVGSGANIETGKHTEGLIGGHQPRAHIPTAAQPTGTTPRISRKDRKFSLSTYELHAVGDYFSTIKTFGTTDSYSTETGELEHRVPKGNYKQTSKKAFLPQLVQIDKRQSCLRLITQAMTNIAPSEVQMSESSTDPSIHYHIGVSQHLKQDFCVFLQENNGDPEIMVIVHCLVNDQQTWFSPVLAVFSVDLQSHLLSRLKLLLGIPAVESGPKDLQSPLAEWVFYKGDALYHHNILRINYTSYDIRRLQDVLNPGTDHHDIILLRRHREPTQHQYRYARILRIYHVNAIYNGPTQWDANVN
ncbi:hypothetical protein DXG01_014753 [Tephrocybe rancida]|nr:hypothetical protein DXG01_014753 [Tephrocybe rancida]